jgi:adenine-specific DNA-methyltransferase
MTGEKKFKAVKKALGKPKFETDKLAIFERDCLEGMKQLPGEIIDLTVTSPPYNIGKSYETKLKLDEYLDWCEKWISEIHRLTEDYGSFWLNLGYLEIPNKAKAVPIPYLLWDRTAFYMMQEVVWNYAAGVACKKRFSPRNEKFLFYVKNESCYTFNLDNVRDPDVKYPNQKKNGILKCNPLGKNPSDVWQLKKVTSGKDRSSAERTPHPAQFPLELIDRIIKVSSNADDLIMDPFMGSGSTAECALRNNRYVIGFEINDQYTSCTKDRITNYLTDKKLEESQGKLPFSV